MTRNYSALLLLLMIAGSMAACTEDVQEAIVDIYAGFIAGMAGLSQSWGTAILAMILVSMFFIAIMKILTRNLIALTHEE